MQIQQRWYADQVALNKAKGKQTAPREVTGRKGFGTFALEATDSNGADVHMFDAPLTITLHYTPAQLRLLGISDASLTLFWFDPVAQTWQGLPTTVDAVARTATAQLDHFTELNFATGTSPSSSFIPSLQGFQTSTFTGAATYSMPIEVPAGPGGLKPNLSLSYSSAATDGVNGLRTFWQAGPVGKGWSLDAGGAVARNVNAGSNDQQWDSFSLVFDGRSYDMVKNQLVNRTGCTLSGTEVEATQTKNTPSCWTWHAVDDAFVRLVASPTSDAWTAWSKDGTRYEFNAPLVWGSNTPANTYQTYKWLLTSVVDTHSNRINYDYHIDPITNTQVLNPSYYSNILWGYDGATPGTGTARYQVHFNTSPRNATPTEGVDLDWDYSEGRISGKFGTPHEAYRIDKIIVNTMQPGQTEYDQMRAYRLNYASLTGSLTTDVSYGQKVLTLLSVQQLGAKLHGEPASFEGSPLPPTSFTYGMSQGTPNNPTAGWNRLETVRNGRGGQITFAYEHAWTTPTMPDWGKYQNYYRLLSVLQADLNSYSKAGLTTYTYTSPALNDDAHSAVVTFARYPTSGNSDNLVYLLRPERAEFRGHYSVGARTYDGPTAQDPLLREEQWWFFQGNGGANLGLNEFACTPVVNVINGVGRVDTNDT